MKRKKFERVVGDTTHAASDLGKDALAQASEYLQQAQEFLAPRAQDALSQANDRIAPLARDARKKGARLAAGAMDAVQPKLDEALDKVSPALDTAYARLAPAVDGARNKVQHGFLPAVSQLLHDAADDIARVEFPEVAQPKTKRSVWATVGKVLLASGLVAGIVFAVKKFLAPEDSGWQAHDTSKPYVPASAQNVADDLAEKAEDAADAARSWIDDKAEKAGDVVEDLRETGEKTGDDLKKAGDDLTDAADKGMDKAADKADEAKDRAADKAAEDDADPFVDSPHGEGSYVGTEPPTGFDIKGNERSMKYHVQGNGGYERTIADVWFSSEEAAEAAGFSKAQR